MQLHTVVGVVCPVGHRLKTLGVGAGADLDAFLKLVKVRDGIERGQSIVGRTGLVKHFAILLEGVACFSTQHEDGVDRSSPSTIRATFSAPTASSSRNHRSSAKCRH